MLVELGNQFRESCFISDQMIVVGENHNRRVAKLKQAISAGGQTDVVFCLDQSIDHCRFAGTDCRESKFRLAIVEDMNRWPLVAVVFVNAADERGAALRAVDRLDAESYLVTHGRFLLPDIALNGSRVCAPALG